MNDTINKRIHEDKLLAKQTKEFEKVQKSDVIEEKPKEEEKKSEPIKVDSDKKEEVFVAKADEKFESESPKNEDPFAPKVDFQENKNDVAPEDPFAPIVDSNDCIDTTQDPFAPKVDDTTNNAKEAPVTSKRREPEVENPTPMSKLEESDYVKFFLLNKNRSSVITKNTNNPSLSHKAISKPQKPKNLQIEFLGSMDNYL